MIDANEKNLLPLHSNTLTGIHINVWLEATTYYVILTGRFHAWHKQILDYLPSLFLSPTVKLVSVRTNSRKLRIINWRWCLIRTLKICPLQQLIWIKLIRSLVHIWGCLVSRHRNTFVKREIARQWNMLVLTRCRHETSCFVSSPTWHLFIYFLTWESKNYFFLFYLSIKGQFYPASHIVVVVVEMKLNSRPTTTLSLVR